MSRCRVNVRLRYYHTLPRELSGADPIVKEFNEVAVFGHHHSLGIASSLKDLMVLGIASPRSRTARHSTPKVAWIQAATDGGNCTSSQIVM